MIRPRDDASGMFRESSSAISREVDARTNGGRASVSEGWVYFVDKEYLTFEVGVKPKEDDLVPMHKKHHILIVCHHWDWHELEYIKNRRGNIDTYKSQVGRYLDPQ